MLPLSSLYRCSSSLLPLVPAAAGPEGVGRLVAELVLSYSSSHDLAPCGSLRPGEPLASRRCLVPVRVTPESRWRQDSKLALFCGLLGGVAVAINAYLAFMVLVVLSAGVITACWRHRLSAKAACGIFAATGGACLISAFAIGLVRSDGGYTGGGYREYSMNLLAPIDPGTFGAFFCARCRTHSTKMRDTTILGRAFKLLTIMLLPSFSRNQLRLFIAAEVVPWLWVAGAHRPCDSTKF